LSVPGDLVGEAVVVVVVDVEDADGPVGGSGG
jgi:hypothetical protein